MVRAKGSYVRPFASALGCDRRPEGYRQSAPNTVATLATRDFLSFRVPDLRFFAHAIQGFPESPTPQA